MLIKGALLSGPGKASLQADVHERLHELARHVVLLLGEDVLAIDLHGSASDNPLGPEVVEVVRAALLLLQLLDGPRLATSRPAAAMLLQVWPTNGRKLWCGDHAGVRAVPPHMMGGNWATGCRGL